MNPWANTLIERGLQDGELPIYGSPEWVALDDTDPRKIASCVRAAERWRQDGQPDAIKAAVLAELEHAEQYFAWRIRQASLDVSDAHDWRAASQRLTWAQLQQRRSLDGTEAA